MNAETTAAEAVVIERTIPAPAERLYRAWLEPEQIEQWMEPGSFRVSRAEVDAQVGGKHRIWHAIDGEDKGGFESEILELVPNERIVFAWGFAGPDRDDPVYDSRLTITFDAISESETKLTLIHDLLDALRAAMPEGAANVGVGWEMVLEKLKALATAEL